MSPIPSFNLYWAEGALNRPFRPITARESKVLVQKFMVLAGAMAFALTAVLTFAIGAVVLRRPPVQMPLVLVAAGQLGGEAPRPPAATQGGPASKTSPGSTRTAVSKPLPAKTIATKPVAKVVAHQAEGPATANLFGDILDGKSTATEAKKSAPRDRGQGQRPRQDDPPDAAPSSSPPSGKPVDEAPAHRFGVVRMDSNEVELESGARVKKGGRFPSGEEVVSIDPRRHRIETNARVIIIKPDGDDTKP